MLVNEYSLLYARHSERTQKYVIMILCGLILFGFCGIMFGIIQWIHKPHTPKLYTILHNDDAKIEFYPQIGAKYAIDFNLSIMQANYVMYVSQNEPDRCLGCWPYKNDPYNYSLMTHDSYGNTGFNDIKLCDDFGHLSMYITNVIPIFRSFYPIWNYHMNFIAANYPNHLTAKGCDYQWNDFVLIVNDRFSRLYYTKSCYWIIFDTALITGLPAPILHYGNIRSTSNVSTLNLPYWVLEV
jgi:hypothetical protein